MPTFAPAKRLPHRIGVAPNFVNYSNCLPQFSGPVARPEMHINFHLICLPIALSPCIGQFSWAGLMGIQLPQWLSRRRPCSAIAAKFTKLKIAGPIQLFLELRAERQKAKQLRQQSLQLDVAMNNMSQGIVMFDSSERIVLWNRRYIEISGLDPEFMRPGRTLRELLQARQGRGSFARNIEEYRHELLQDMANGNTESLIFAPTTAAHIKSLTSPWRVADGSPRMKTLPNRCREERDREADISARCRP